MRYFTLLICLFANGLLLGQEELSPTTYNVELYTRTLPFVHNNHQGNYRAATYINESDVLFSDTLGLPFLDDFSTNTLLSYHLAYTDSALATGSCLVSNGISLSSRSYMLSQSWYYSFNTGTQQLDSFPLASINLRSYEPVSSCFDSYNNVLVYPIYYRPTVIDSASGMVEDSALIQADTTLGVAWVHFGTVNSNANWIDNFAYINSNLPILPPSVGVATLDGLNPYGRPYDNSSATRYGSADKLTSKPIDLSSYSEADSVYLSFFYQARGNGDWPNTRDSLIVEIRDRNDGNWYPVWSHEGFASSADLDDDFHIAMIKLLDPVSTTDPNPWYNGFQFRFRNKASLAGNNDHWHIDYVRLDQSRNLLDTSIADIALVQDMGSVLQEYTLMPYRQFDNSDWLITWDENIRNLNPATTPSTDWNVQVNNITAGGAFYTSPVLSFPADALVSRSFNPLSDFPTYTTIPDSSVLETKFQIAPSSNNLILSNDTVSHKQIFANLLAYDDGTAEKAYGLIGPGLKKFAYKFHLRNTDTLAGVQIMFTNIDEDVSNLVFNIYAYSALQGIDGATEDIIMSSKELVKPHYVDSINGWTTYLFDSLILTSGDFYIGFSQTDERNLQIGYDMNSTRGYDKVMINFGSGWNPTSLTNHGSPMIRALIDGNYKGFSTAVKEVKHETDFQLYPNPTNGILYIKTTKQVTHIAVFDLSGRMLLENFNNSSIQLETLTSGVYLVKVEDENGASSVEKIYRY